MIGAAVSRVTGLLDGFASSAVLLREAARTSRRWQTYAARTGFSGALFGVLLLGIWTVVNAPFVDVSNLSYAGRAIFVAFSVVLLMMAILLAPLMTSAAMIEETEDRTLEMLILSKLLPSQILAGKVLSRILILITIVFGAMPVMALVVTLGGVAPQQVVAVTVHTLVAVVLMGSLGAFFGLFTRSPMLAMLAAAAYSIPIFWLLPVGYVMCTGNPADAAHFSLFAGPAVEDWTSPIALVSYLPSLVVIFVIGTRLFDLKVSSADIRRAFSAETWSTKAWAWGLGIIVVLGCTVLPLASVGAWMLRYGVQHPSLLQQAGIVLCVGLIWLWWMAALTLSTWALLRVGVDVVDAMDAILGGRGRRKRDRRNFKIWSNPVMWREARPQSWGGNGVPVLATWLLIMLGMLQTGWWIIPGGSLAMGVMNTLAAMALTVWLAARTIHEERRQKSLEVLLTTTMASPRILLGKAAGVAVPTFPLLCLSLPFLAFGVPHVHMFDLLDSGNSDGMMLWFIQGCLTWLWTLPVWGVLLWGGLLVALRIRRSRSGFSVAIGALIAVMGVPAILGRLFEELPLIAVPCRMIVPPLAGGAAVWQYAVAIVGWSLAAVGLFVWTSVGLRRWISAGLGVLLAVSVGLSGTAQAQSSQRVPVQDGFLILAQPLGDGIVRAGEWAPLRVKILNRGPNAVGELVMIERSGTQSRSFRRPVELPQGTQKDVILLYRPNGSVRDREIVLQTRDGRKAVAGFQLQAAREEDVTIGVMGTDLMGMQKIRQALGAVPGSAPRPYRAEPRRVYSGLLEPGVLPAHSAGYEAFDELVWPRADPSGLDPAQAAALRGYVADGGHLLLTVTENWQGLMGSGLAEMLPVRFEGTEDRADLDGFLASMGGQPREIAVPVARGEIELLPGRSVFVLAETDEGAPLWVVGSYGLGTVSVLMVDPTVEPFKGNIDVDSLWRALLHLDDLNGRRTRRAVLRGQHRYATGELQEWGDAEVQLNHLLHRDDPLADSILGGNLFWLDPYEYVEVDDPQLLFEAEVRGWLADIPGVAPLPMSWMLVFSGLYLFAIGPLDWFALRMLKKQPWTWVSFPITIVLFSAVALGGTAWMKGSQAMVSTLEVVDLLPGTNLWRGEAYVGVFATRATRVGLTSNVADSVAQPLEEPGYMLDPSVSGGFGPGQIQYGTNTWTLGYSELRWLEEAPGDIGFEVLDEGWAITNQLPFALTDSELIFTGPRGGSAMRFSVGPLGPGERKIVSFSDGGPISKGSGEDGDLGWMRQRALDAPTPGRGYLDVNGSGFVLLATAERLTELRIEGVRPIHRNRTLIRAPLTPSLDPRQRGSAVIPGFGGPQ